jgi:predicted SAM-dependent methyltransferase
VATLDWEKRCFKTKLKIYFALIFQTYSSLICTNEIEVWLFINILDPSISYVVMDVVEKIDFPPGSVDLIIDKGLIDAILCGEGFFEHVKKYLSECWRVLKLRGTLMILSQGHPDTRVLYLKNKAFPFGLNI